MTQGAVGMVRPMHSPFTGETQEFGDGEVIEAPDWTSLTLRYEGEGREIVLDVTNVGPEDVEQVLGTFCDLVRDRRPLVAGP